MKNIHSSAEAEDLYILLWQKLVQLKNLFKGPEHCDITHAFGGMLQKSIILLPVISKIGVSFETTTTTTLFRPQLFPPSYGVG